MEGATHFIEVWKSRSGWGNEDRRVKETRLNDIKNKQYHLDATISSGHKTLYVWNIKLKL